MTQRGMTQRKENEKKKFASVSQTSDGLLQELRDGVSVVRIDGTGEQKLSLHLCEALSQQLPTPTQRLSHQGLSEETETQTSLENGKTASLQPFPPDSSKARNDKDEIPSTICPHTYKQALSQNTVLDAPALGTHTNTHTPM